MSQNETDGRGRAPGTQAVLAMTAMANKEECQVLKDAFLASLEECWPRIARAYRAHSIPRTTVYRWRAEDERFRSRWDDIQEAHLDDIEGNVVDVSRTKGGAGYGFPVLKAYRKDRYGDKIEHSGQVANVTVVTPVNLTDAETPKPVGEGRG